MSLDAQSDFSAAVLAGGRSSRMGRDKAFLPWREGRLIDRQLGLLRELRPKQIFISGRPGVDYACPEATVIYDDEADGGPLAGLAALLGACESAHLLVLAVDMPGMTRTFLAELLALKKAEAAVVPRLEGRWEPLAALYPTAMQSLAATNLRCGARSMRNFVKAAEQRGEVVPLLVESERKDLFRNWNCPEDLKK